MTATRTAQRETNKQAWAGGLTAFGAVVLMISGLLGVFRGIMAIAEDDVFVTTPDYVFEFDLTGWGWFHLLLGAFAVIVGLGLFQAATWARVAGVAIAGLLIIVNFLSLPYYPLWSIVVIGLLAVVIWALCVVRTDTSDGWAPRDD
ncbi:hypothetical protein [Streptomyces sp. TRM49041]|uniref:DUF7144 family membrane protein n=1 Tax=Streptomyces sp. TRM49041 TaxID=2603216 RepID=UPI0011EF8F07|nr:hypothetical protein [Streptomyces sp. TRM49041]